MVVVIWHKCIHNQYHPGPIGQVTYKTSHSTCVEYRQIYLSNSHPHVSMARSRCLPLEQSTPSVMTKINVNALAIWLWSHPIATQCKVTRTHLWSSNCVHEHQLIPIVKILHTHAYVYSGPRSTRTRARHSVWHETGPHAPGSPHAPVTSHASVTSHHPRTCALRLPQCHQRLLNATHLMIGWPWSN